LNNGAFSKVLPLGTPSTAEGAPFVEDQAGYTTFRLRPNGKGVAFTDEFGIARAFMGPAAQSLLPNLVPTEDLAGAIAISTSAWQFATIVGPVAALGAQDAHLEKARRVLSQTPLFDGHNDLPWAIRENASAPHDVVAYDLRKTAPGHTDIARLRAGMVGAQFWSVYIPATSVQQGAAKTQLEQMDIAKQIFARYPDVFQETLSPDAVMPAFRAGRIASVMGMEGGHAIENSLGALRAFYGMGARYLTLTHFLNNNWADSSTDKPKHNGLTAFGKFTLDKYVAAYTAPELRASHRSWKPPRPMSATMRPSIRAASAARSACSPPASRSPAASSNERWGPQNGQAFGWAWNRRLAGSAYSFSHWGHIRKPRMVVFGRS